MNEGTRATGLQGGATPNGRFDSFPSPTPFGVYNMKIIYDNFPYRNPKNAYMWGAIHSMFLTTVVLSIITVVCL